jgi:hypothetical protein
MNIFQKIWHILFGGPAMAGKRPRDRDYTITVSRQGGPCDVGFVLNPPGLTFSNGGRPGFFVYFDVVDGDGVEGCKFHADDPMWVQDIPECPAQQCEWQQFKAVGLINDGKTLVVRNKNEISKQFGFTLRFDVPGCGQVVEFDPIGNNQNGPQ